MSNGQQDATPWNIVGNFDKYSFDRICRMNHDIDLLKAALEAERNKVKELELALEWLAKSTCISGYQKEKDRYYVDASSMEDESNWFFHASTPLLAIQFAMKANTTK